MRAKARNLSGIRADFSCALLTVRRRRQIHLTRVHHDFCHRRRRNPLSMRLKGEERKKREEAGGSLGINRSEESLLLLHFLRRRASRASSDATHEHTHTKRTSAALIVILSLPARNSFYLFACVLRYGRKKRARRSCSMTRRTPTSRCVLHTGHSASSRATGGISFRGTRGALFPSYTRFTPLSGRRVFFLFYARFTQRIRTDPLHACAGPLAIFSR